MNSEQKKDEICLAESQDVRVFRGSGGLEVSTIPTETDRLLRIAALAEEFNHDRISDDARSAAKRIAEGRFYVACAGQCKRGKSTLLNALMGESILPTGVIPVTAVPTIVRFGERHQARVRLSQSVFRTLATALFAGQNRPLVKSCGKKGWNALKDKSAVSLRGMVTDALREKGYWAVLDHARSPSQSYSNGIKDVCSLSDTPLIAVARSPHMEDVGFLLPMFSNRSGRFALRNFDPHTAKQFAAQVANTTHLQALNRDEAIRKIVGFSKGNPGAIIRMLQMAASPKYVAQEHVKLSPLSIDFRLSWSATHG